MRWLSDILFINSKFLSSLSGRVYLKCQSVKGIVLKSGGKLKEGRMVPSTSRKNVSSSKPPCRLFWKTVQTKVDVATLIIRFCLQNIIRCLGRKRCLHYASDDLTVSSEASHIPLNSPASWKTVTESLDLSFIA